MKCWMFLECFLHFLEFATQQTETPIYKLSADVILYLFGSVRHSFWRNCLNKKSYEKWKISKFLAKFAIVYPNRKLSLYTKWILRLSSLINEAKTWKKEKFTSKTFFHFDFISTIFKYQINASHSNIAISIWFRMLIESTRNFGKIEAIFIYCGNFYFAKSLFRPLYTSSAFANTAVLSLNAHKAYRFRM